MKTISNVTSFTLAGLLASAVTMATAQVQPQPSQQTPDSVVAVVADAQGLAFVPPEQRPVFGTFWDVHTSLPCLGAPLPCPPRDPATPVYAIGDPVIGGQFLVDETAGQAVSSQAQSGRRILRSMNAASILQAQVEELQTFVAQVQSSQANAQLRASGQMSSLSDGPPTPGEGGGGTNRWDGGTTFNAFQHNSNDLCLVLLAMTNTTGSFIIYPPTIDEGTGVYDLFMTTNLSSDVPGLNLTNWLWVLRTDPGETNLLVPSLWADQAFFMLARTNDTDGDGLSDAYEHLVSHTSPTNADAPLITFQPLSQDVVAGDAVTFAVAAVGTAPLSYQWMLSGTNISGETNASLTLGNAVWDQAGDYSVRVTSPLGLSVISSNATLSIEDPWGNYIPLWGARQDFTFKSGFTYVLYTPVLLYGRTTIQGGTVIKLDTWRHSTLQVFGTLVTDAKPYYPGILTCVDDDSAGQWVDWSNHLPVMLTNGYPYLDLTHAQGEHPAISNLRFSYADQAVTTPSSAAALDVWDCQFVQCNVGVANGITNAPSADRLHNVLFAGCQTAVQALGTNASITGEHITADITSFWAAPSAPARISLTNSIILGTIASGPALITDHCALNPASPVFQTNGVGNYYLTNGSPYRGAGTAAVSPRLLAEFREKTTCPPVTFPALMNLTGQLTLGPQAARYAGGAPDYGFYYAALDYTVAWMTSWGTITVLPGTTIGLRNEPWPEHDHWTWWGFDLREGSTFSSQGTAARPNTFVDVQFVQEQLTFPCNASFVPDFRPNNNGDAAPSLDFRFSNFYVPQGYNFHIWAGYDETCNFLQSPDSLLNWTMRDCNLHGGRVNLGPPDDGYYYGAPMDWVYGSCAVSWFNNLFDNVAITLDPTYYWYNAAINCELSFQAYNNLFHGGLWFFISPIPTANGNWTFKDNLFDTVDFVQDTNAPLDFNYNGYWPLSSCELEWAWGRWNSYNQIDWFYYPLFVPNTAQLSAATTGGGNEQVLTAAPPYQKGPLGDYYLPIATPLYHAGSRPATDAGLFHYTTRADQVKEGDEGGTHAVSIGLHYVATTGATNSLQMDTDRDGVPDYAEDANGNGLQDEGETAWLTSDPPAPTVGGTIALPGGTQVLTGLITVIATAFASPSNNVANVELLDVDLFSGYTATLASIDVDAPSTNIAFDIESSNLRNGWHLLQLRVTDDNGGDHFSGTTPNTSLSSPVVARSQNDIYLLNEDSLSVGWMWHLEFGTTVQDGTWRINMYDDTGALWKSFDGYIAGSLTANGTIQVSDWFTDDGNGGQRPRTSADEYPGEYFDVAIVATAAAGGQTPPPNSIKYIRTRIAHRPNSRVSCVVEAPMINRTGLRSIIDPMMDVSYVGLAPLSRHFYVSRMASAADQSPSAMGWNYCDTPQLWTNLNKFLAGSAVDKCTHLFALAHGDKTGFGQRVWSLGPGDHVSRTTLDTFGYSYFTNISVTVTGPPPATGTFTARIVVRQTGLTFAFIDGCNAAGFLWNLALDPMNISHPTLQDLINAGRFPYYGCSWTKSKQVATFGPGGFANDVLWQHADYVGRFCQFATDIDQNTGLPKWNYRQAREKAKYYSNSPNTVNPWSGGWDHAGCDELYIDE